MISAITNLGPAAFAIVGFISTIGVVTAIYGLSLLQRRMNSGQNPRHI